MGVRAGYACTHTHFPNYLYLGLSCYKKFRRMAFNDGSVVVRSQPNHQPPSLVPGWTRS